MNKGKLTVLIRSLGMMMFADFVKFNVYRLINFRKNRAFRARHPGIKLPPDYMVFESFKLDYEKYYDGGMESAAWVVSVFSKYTSVDGKRVLDWGCGPARITRHLSGLMQKAEIVGTDYNLDTVEWCRQNIPNALFHTNTINSQLPFPDDRFDLIIGISIFTHLSEINHQFWIKELYRVIGKGGIILLTTAGAAFKSQMTDSEAADFESNRLVVRSNVMEGHRTYAAFQPVVYFRDLCSPYFDILECKEGVPKSWGIEQDYWILKAKK